MSRDRTIDQRRVFTYDSASMTPANPIKPPAPSIDLAPYTGRWVAVVRGLVAGSGCSPREALLQARLARPKDEPIIVFVPKRLADGAAR